MANQGQSFIFRFPWFGQQKRTPRSEPTRPTQETRTLAQMTAALAGQGPDFRSAKIAPTQPPPAQSQPPTTEPQTQTPPPSPSRAPKESRGTSQPPSPSVAPKESLATSQPPSPSLTPKESRAPSQPPSLSLAPKESRATSQPSSPSHPKTQTGAGASQLPSSPSRAASQSRASSDSPSKSPTISKPQPQPDTQTASSQPQSPSGLARGMTSPQATSPSRLQPKAEAVWETPAGDKDGSQSALLPSQPSSETRRVEQEAESQPPLQLQQPQKKMDIQPLETPMTTASPADNGEIGTAQASDTAATSVPAHPEDKGVAVSQPASPETTAISPTPSREDREATKTAEDAEEAIASGSGQMSDIGGGDQKTVFNAEEGKTSAEVEFPKEEETKRAAHVEEPVQKRIVEHVPSVTGRRKRTRDPAKKIAAFPVENWEQRREAWDEEEDSKVKVATAGYIGKQIKTVGSAGNTSNSSFQNAILSAGDQGPRHEGIKEDISKLVRKLTTEEHQMVDTPVTVITLTGENRGASMNVSSQPAHKEESIHIHRGYKLNPDDSHETTIDGEVNSSEGTKLEDHPSGEAPPIKAYANSNVQGVNNSVVFNASVNERNPGIHLEFSQDDAAPTRINGRSESHRASRAEFSITPSEQLTHGHTVKRRCLRGLFLESSDSEPDNPDKPRRHGCRYGCFENKKDRELGA